MLNVLLLVDNRMLLFVNRLSVGISCNFSQSHKNSLLFPPRLIFVSLYMLEALLMQHHKVAP